MIDNVIVPGFDSSVTAYLRRYDGSIVDVSDATNIYLCPVTLDGTQKVAGPEVESSQSDPKSDWTNGKVHAIIPKTQTATIPASLTKCALQVVVDGGANEGIYLPVQTINIKLSPLAS